MALVPHKACTMEEVVVAVGEGFVALVNVVG